MQRAVHTALVAVVCLLPTPAKADRVVLDDGQVFEGIVTVDDDLVSIELDVGTIAFNKDEVREIERSDTPVHEYNRRRAAIDPTDVSAVQALAQWATDQGLTNRAGNLHELVVAQAPNNERSRLALGHIRRDGKWVDPKAELLARLAAEHERMAEEARRSADAEVSPAGQAPTTVAPWAVPAGAAPNGAYGPNEAWNPWFGASFLGFAPGFRRGVVGRGGIGPGRLGRFGRFGRSGGPVGRFGAPGRGRRRPEARPRAAPRPRVSTGLRRSR